VQSPTYHLTCSSWRWGSPGCSDILAAVGCALQGCRSDKHTLVFAVLLPSPLRICDVREWGSLLFHAAGWRKERRRSVYAEKLAIRRKQHSWASPVFRDSCQSLKRWMDCILNVATHRWADFSTGGGFPAKWGSPTLARWDLRRTRMFELRGKLLFRLVLEGTMSYVFRYPQVRGGEHYCGSPI